MRVAEADMKGKPLTLIVRLWHRPEGLRAEVRHLQTGERHMFRSATDLMSYLEGAK
ncbi:MAG: hypothetical protein KC422_25560 [Trueperaceae bacterium]|nr:hypothetical protein [Trueperaceae bacterium]